MSSFPDNNAGTDAANPEITLRASTAELIEAFWQRPDQVQPIVERLSQLRETAILALWPASCDSEAALIATGGFGRREIFPHSDIDLLILVKHGIAETAIGHISNFVNALWGLKLKIGHSVQTPTECIAHARQDLHLATSILESRLLAGSATLYQELEERMQAQDFWPYNAFFDAKHAELKARHARYRDTAYNLEPNLKEGPGGLRDMQTMQWLALRQRQTSNEPFMPLEAAPRPDQASLVLWQLRFALHDVAKRNEERLLFDYQLEIAKRCDPATSEKNAVEILMRRYYRAAAEIRHAYRYIAQNHAERQYGATAETVDEDYVKIGDLLAARSNDLFERRPDCLMRAFWLLARHADLIGLHTSLQTAIARALRDGPQAWRAQTVDSIFLDILRATSGQTKALSAMAEQGVLQVYLPAFAHITGRLQYDHFHAYTIDQHSLFAIQFLESFRSAKSQDTFALAHAIIGEIPRPELVFLAALFHDIGKGYETDHSEKGAEIAANFLAAMELPPADIELVRWLVQEHLTLSVTAQKKDLSNPEVVDRFAATMRDEERLKCLYLLTVADICATSPKLWNAWRDRLLSDLYRATLECLRQNERAGADDGRVARTKALAMQMLQEQGMNENRVTRIWQDFPEECFFYYAPEQITWHTVTLEKRTDAIRAQPFVTYRETPSPELIELCVYAKDREGLFATITAELDRMQLDIVNARIITSLAGYSMDTFQLLVPKALQHGLHLHAMAARLSQAIAQPEPPAPARRLPPARDARRQIPLSVRFSGLGARSTELSIVCADRPGLLARLSRIFHGLKLNIHAARIATFGERVEDFFELSQAGDQALDEDCRRELAQTIEQHLKD